MDCSIVIPTYRGAHRLPGLLDSLVSQDATENMEVVVVLDGEDAETRAVVTAYAPRLNLQIVANEVAQGASSAMNLGISKATGRIVFRCDDDLRLPSDFVRRHMIHHEAPNVGVISATRDVFPSENHYGRVYGKPANARALEATYARATDLAWIGWAACNSVDRSALLHLGGFNSELPYGEDSELGFRLYRSGVEIVVDREAEVEHLGPALGAETRIPRAFISGASKKSFRQLHPGALPTNKPADSARAHLWRLAVGCVAHALRSREASAVAGRITSSGSKLLPEPLAAKLLALMVEAASLAGQRYGHSDVAVYKGQKARDIARERM